MYIPCPAERSARLSMRIAPDAGETITAIADLWELQPTEIESALRYELTSRTA